MTNQNTWATPQLMVDWFNQLDDPDAFFKETVIVDFHSFEIRLH